jgi:tripartite-type tricarboxylate transporter receptor subunit TctC
MLKALDTRQREWRRDATRSHAACDVGLGRRAILAFAALLPMAARAQPGFPTRTVRVVVPYAPGGGTDIIARIMAQHAAAASSQSFVVENRGGGASIPGTQAVATAAADGYTIGVMDVALVTNPGLFGAQLPYDAERDLAAIGAVAASPLVLLAHPGRGVRSLADFLAQARVKPGELALAYAGNGSANHLAAVELQQAAGLQLSLVSYRGVGPANMAVAGGDVPFGISNIPAAKGQVEGGLMQALAVTGARRSPAMPGVPTFAELGLPRVDTQNVFGIVAPAGVPAPLVQRLNELMVRPAGFAPAGPRLEELGYSPMAGSAEDYAALVRTEIARWSDIIRSAGVKPE